MVTTTSAQDALLFALDVQTTLYDHDWDWDGADDFYRETTLAFSKPAEGEDEYNDRATILRTLTANDFFFAKGAEDIWLF